MNKVKNSAVAARVPVFAVGWDVLERSRSGLEGLSEVVGNETCLFIDFGLFLEFPNALDWQISSCKRYGQYSDLQHQPSFR